MNPAGQIPLALTPPRRPGFGNFLAGPNAVAVETLKSGLEPGQWYFLAGPAGSGRTHLALATVAARAAAGAQARYLPLARPGSIQLLADSRGDWLVLDDVDALAGDVDAERGLFNALNQWRADRSGVVMTGAGRAGFGLPDLKSRLNQAARLTLHPLGDTHLAELIRMLAAEREMILGRGLEDYLLRHGPRSPGQVARLLEALAGRALAEQRVPSIPLARSLLRAEDL